MKFNIFSTFTLVLGRFFHGAGSGFFRIGSGFLADPDPDSEKSLIRIREKKNRSETLLLGLVFVPEQTRLRLFKYKIVA